MKSMCHDVRRSSPSVTVRRPASRCSAMTSRIASSSAARRTAASMSPALKAARARRSASGRRRLPTWSARKGGVVRAVMLGELLRSGGRGSAGPLHVAGAQRDALDPRRQHCGLVVDRADVAEHARGQLAGERALAGDALELALAGALDDAPRAVGVVGDRGGTLADEL